MGHPAYQGIAIVTGGGMGLGRAIAVRLAALGHDVVIADVAVAAARETARLVAAAHRTAAGRDGETLQSLVVETDVTQRSSVESLFAQVDAHFAAARPLRVVVNNAGVSELGDYVENESNALAEKEIAINLTGVVQVQREAIRMMRRRNVHAAGHATIVNIASMAGLNVMPLTPIYCATKAAVVHFSRSSGTLLKMDDKGVPVNVVALCPSFVDTPLTQAYGDEFKEMIKGFGVGRMMQPEDIAEAVARVLADNDCAGGVLKINMRPSGDVVYRWDYNARDSTGRPYAKPQAKL